jgi:hypothetical protein
MMKLLIVTDSLSVWSLGSQQGTTLKNIFDAHFSDVLDVKLLAYPAQKAEDIQGLCATEAAAFFEAGAKAVVMAGFNNLFVGQSISTTKGHLQDLVNQIIGYGYETAVCELFATTNATVSPSIDGLNTQINDISFTKDYVIHTGSHPILGNKLRVLGENLYVLHNL